MTDIHILPILIELGISNDINQSTQFGIFLTNVPDIQGM